MERRVAHSETLIALPVAQTEHIDSTGDGDLHVDVEEIHMGTEVDGVGEAEFDISTTPGVLPAGFFSFSGDDNLEGIGDEILS